MSCENDVHCTMCKNGYGLMSSGCGACQDSNCLSCDGKLDRCSACDKRYSADERGRCLYKWSLLLSIAIVSIVVVFFIILLISCVSSKEDVEAKSEDLTSPLNYVLEQEGLVSGGLPRGPSLDSDPKEERAAVYASILGNDQTAPLQEEVPQGLCCSPEQAEQHASNGIRESPPNLERCSKQASDFREMT